MKKIVLIVFALAAAMILAGCGVGGTGGEEATGTEITAAPTETAAATGEPNEIILPRI